jgi:cbb3-type cytochrome oxidase maturation protein
VVAFIVFVLYWSVRSGQFEDLEGPGHAILMDDDNPKPQSNSQPNSLSKEN